MLKRLAGVALVAGAVLWFDAASADDPEVPLAFIPVDEVKAYMDRSSATNRQPAPPYPMSLTSSPLPPHPALSPSGGEDEGEGIMSGVRGRRGQR